MVHVYTGSYSRSRGGAAAAQVAAMLTINNEMLRVTNGQPHLYSETQLAPIRQQIADEYRVRSRVVFEARYKAPAQYNIGGALFLLVAVPSIAVQAYAVIVNDQSVNKFSGFM